jgi:hypothetical protein
MQRLATVAFSPGRRVLLAAVLGLLLAGCAGPRGAVGGLLIQKGTAVAIDPGPGDQERASLARKLRRYGFSVSSEPGAEYAVRVDFRRREPGFGSCTIVLARFGQPIVSASAGDVPIAGAELQAPDRPDEGWRRRAFDRALSSFGKRLFAPG